MGLKRRILGFFTFLFITILSAHAMAASYSCDEKQYDSCNSGYFMTVNGVYNGTPTAGNACTACPNGAKCAGGTAGPVYSCSLGYYYNGSGCISCDENYYCPGGYEGKQLCPSAYALADGGAGGTEDCYLILNPGNYVATAHGGQTACPAGSYCPGGSRVYYENTGGATTCPDNSNSGAGKTFCTCNTGYNYNGGTTTTTNTCVANTYTIKYDANGGTGTMSNTTCTYGSDCTLRTNAFTRTGYTFAGWTYNGTSYSNGQSVPNLTPTNGATLTFTAQWTANTYTLTLDRNGATSGDTTATIQYGANGFCSAGSKTDATCSLNIYTPYRTGYTFNGYFTEQTGGTMWIDNNGYPVSSTMITSSRTLYAQYTANKYSCPAGEYLSGTSCVTCPAGSYCPGVTKQEYDGGVHGLNTCPTNSNSSAGASSCTCNTGYNYNGGTSVTTNACVANTYTLTYSANNGSGTMPDKTCTYGQDCIVDTNAFTRTGYSFAGWMCYGGNCNGGKQISSGTNFKNTETGNGVTLTITPEWTPNTYTVTLNGNGANYGNTTCPENLSSSVYYTYDSTMFNCGPNDEISAVEPHVWGNSYTFNGYFTEKTGGQKIINTDGTLVAKNLITSDTTLYAQWTQILYKCPAGQYLNGNTCKECPAGSYCPGVTDQEYTGGDIGVITCPENSSSEPGASVCTCNDGFINNGGTTTTTNACVAGYKFFMTTTPDTTEFSFTIDAAGTFYIDWGDGDTETIEKTNTSNQTISHTYTSAKSYTIKLGGKAIGYDTYYYATISFYKNLNLAKIDGSLGQIFSTLSDGSQPRFRGTFQGCTNLTGEIPAELFSGISGAPASYMFDETFSRCSGLSGNIPKNLFAGIEGAPAEYMFYRTFDDCSGLTGSIPENLFAGISGAPAEYMFNGTFLGCSNLSGKISENLFNRIDSSGKVHGLSGTPANSMFSSTFSGCKGLTGNIPENLFTKFDANGNIIGGIIGAPAEYMFSTTFGFQNERGKLTGCSGLTGNIPTKLFAGISGAPAPGMFHETFSDCSGLTGNIPAELFAGISGAPAEQMFDGTFWACSGLTGSIPENLFTKFDNNGNIIGGIKGAPAYGMFSSTFSACSGLSGSIPENLFAGIEGAPASEMFRYTFDDCSGLTGSIPENLFTKFDENGNIIGGIVGKPAWGMFHSTFSGCDGLTGNIPENLFAGISGEPAIEMFMSTFNNADNISGFIPPKLFAGISKNTTARNQMSLVFIDSGLDTTCPEGYYQYITGFERYFDGRVSCTPCPAGYTNAGPGLTSESQCVMTVKPGYYIKNPGDTEPTICPAGSYCTGGNVPYGSTGPINACPAITNPYGAASTTLMSNDGFSSPNNCMAIYTFAEKFLVNEIISDTNSEYSSESNANKRGTYYVACHYNPTSGNYDTDCLSGYPIYTGCGSGYYFINSDKMDWNTGDAMQEAFNVALNTDTLEQSIEQICHITDVDHWSPGLQDCYDKYTTDEDRDACVTSKLPAGCTTDNFDGCAGKTLWSQHPCPENSSTRGLTGQEYCVCDEGYTVDGTANGATTTMYDACIRAEVTITYDVNGGSGAVASQTCPIGKPCDLKTPEQIGHDMYRPGYVFVEWESREKKGDTTYITRINNYKHTFDKDTTLYAIWSVCDRGFYKSADANAGDQCTACPAVTNPYGANGTDLYAKDLNGNGGADSIDECVGEYFFAEKYFANTPGDDGYAPDAPANKRGTYVTGCHYNPATKNYDKDCFNGWPIYNGCASGHYFSNNDLIDWTHPEQNEDEDRYFVKTDTLEQAIEQICIETDIDHWSPGLQDCYDKYTNNDDITACLFTKVKQCNLTMDDVHNDLTDEQLYCVLDAFWSQHPCPENSSTRGLTGQEYCVCDDGYTVDGTANGATTTMYDACIKAEIILTYDVNGANGAVAQQTCPADSPCDIKTPSQIGQDMYRPGYVFDGWALNENDTTPIDYQYTFNENTTVYAIWTPCANGTYKTADANAGEQCSACSDLGTEYTFSDIASTSANQCHTECMEYSVVYGTAIPLEQYKFWPNKCEYRGESETGNPCDIIDGVCVEKSCNYDYEMVNGRCQPCNRENALTYKPTGNCVVATCGYGYHADGQYCVGDTKACSAPNAISAHQVWDTNKNAFSECLITECESGYHVSENVCQLDDQTCELEHGFGEREWDDQTNSWGKCVATYCEPGYTNDPDQTNESWEQCGRCNNMYTTDGIMAVSSYVQGCEIASCMNQGEQFILDGNECRLICDEYSDETGRRYWDGKKCVHECAGGYTQW